MCWQGPQVGESMGLRSVARSGEIRLVPQPKLRIYYGSETQDVVADRAPASGPPTVTIALADVFPLLAEAAGNRRAWLSDFADDQITISADLYEIIMAYQHYRRPLESRAA
jgi:hypothetical protein